MTFIVLQIFQPGTAHAEKTEYPSDSSRASNQHPIPTNRITAGEDHIGQNTVLCVVVIGTSVQLSRYVRGTGGGALNFFSGRVCGPDFQSVGLAN